MKNSSILYTGIKRFNINGSFFLKSSGNFEKTSDYYNFSNIQYFFHCGKEIVLLDKYQRLLNVNDFPNIPNNFAVKLHSSSSEFFILINEEINEEAIYSLQTRSIVYKNEVVGNVIEDNYILDCSAYRSAIKIMNIRSFEIISTFPLDNLGTWQDGAVEKPYRVSEFSGIYKNTLICTMNSGGILLLDIDKGVPKQFFKEAKVRGGIFRKEENSPIFWGLKHYTFIEINAETGELIRQVNIEDELKRVADISSESPSWLSVGTSVYQDGLFYFYGDKNFLGIFDPVNEEIIDYHWFKFENKHTQLKGGVENLQVKENEIYCLDTANTLHVLCR